MTKTKLERYKTCRAGCNLLISNFVLFCLRGQYIMVKTGGKLMQIIRNRKTTITKPAEIMTKTQRKLLWCVLAHVVTVFPNIRESVL